MQYFSKHSFTTLHHVCTPYKDSQLNAEPDPGGSFQETHWVVFEVCEFVLELANATTAWDRFWTKIAFELRAFSAGRPKSRVATTACAPVTLPHQKEHFQQQRMQMQDR